MAQGCVLVREGLKGSSLRRLASRMGFGTGMRIAQGANRRIGAFAFCIQAPIRLPGNKEGGLPAPFLASQENFSRGPKRKP